MGTGQSTGQGRELIQRDKKKHPIRDQEGKCHKQGPGLQQSLPSPFTVFVTQTIEILTGLMKPAVLQAKSITGEKIC